MSRYDELFGAPFNSAEGGYSAPLAGDPGVDYSSPYSGATDLYDPSDLDLKIDPVSIALTIAGMVGNYWMNERNNDRNEALQREAHDRNVELWRMQTAYNTPAAQMARLKAAGLNPNLMYGSPQNTASAAPEKKVSERKSFQFDPLTMINAMQISKQMEVADSQIQRNQAEAMNFEAGARNYDADSRLKGEELSWRPTQREMEQEIVRFTNMLRESESKLNDEQRRDLSNRIDEWLKFAPQREQEFTNRLNQQIEDLKLTQEQQKYYKNLAAKINKEFQFLEKQIGVLFSPSKWEGKSLYQAAYEFGVDNKFQQNSLLKIQETIQGIYRDIYNTEEFKDAMKTKFELQDDFFYSITQRLNMITEPFKGFVDFEFNLFNSTNGVPTPGRVPKGTYVPTYTK